MDFFDQPLSEVLKWLLGFCVTVIIIPILVGSRVIPKLVTIFDTSILRGVMSSLTCIVALAWMMSFLLVVIFETVGLEAAIRGTEPPFKAVYLLVPVLISVLFPLFVANAWRLGVALFGALAVGLNDLFGNSQIIDGMYCVAEGYRTQQIQIPAGFQPWIDYYLKNNQLTRVSTYMIIVAIGIVFYLLTAAREFDLPPNASPRLRRSAALILRNKEYIRVVCHLLFVFAIINNAWWIWPDRISREVQLRDQGLSVIYGLDRLKNSVTQDDTSLLQSIRAACNA